MSLLHAARPALLATVVAGAAVALTGGVASSGAQEAEPAPTSSTPQLAWRGHVKIELATGFLRDLERARAVVRTKRGASYRRKSKTLVFKVKGSTPLGAAVSVPTEGLAMLRRKGGRKVIVDDLALRIGEPSADLRATLRDEEDQQLALFVADEQSVAQPIDDGYQFKDVGLLVSDDLEAAARAAKLTGIEAGEPFGTLTAKVKSETPGVPLPMPIVPVLDLPSFEAPDAELPDGEIPKEIRDLLESLGLGDQLPPA